MPHTRTIMMLLAGAALVVAGVAPSAGAWSDLVCKECRQQVGLRATVLDEKLQLSLAWDRPYLLGGLEPEFQCTEGTVQTQSFLPAPDYDVSSSASCSFSPWPDPYNPGLHSYAGPCCMADDAQLALALTYPGVWNHVVIEADQTVSIPVEYHTMSAVLLGNADPVDWAFECAVWYNTQTRYTVANGTIHGHVNTTSYWHIEVPRFPTLCQDQRFVVRAPVGATARVYSILVERRVCDPNSGEPVAAPQ